VISIIGILAGLVIPLSGVATARMRTARVKAELNNYVNAIENYKLETGEYPPDNGELKLLSSTHPSYKTNAAMHPLYYELSGAIFTNGEFVTVAENETLKIADLDKFFKRKGLRNSARNRFDIDYKGFSVRENQIAELAGPPEQDVEILAVPVPGPFYVEGKGGKKIYPWFYDASSTNRRNKASFDLWAEIKIGKQTNIIGNWKE
jgi:type II secretory pathway pseudopilin PulG